MKQRRLQTSFSLLASLLLLILSLAAFSGCGVGGDEGSTGALTGSVSLSWDPPTAYDDPESTPLPLSDIAGYKIYFGESSGVYDYSLSVGNVTTNYLDHLPVGIRLYFAVTATDVLGVEGSYSAEASTIL